MNQNHNLYPKNGLQITKKMGTKAKVMINNPIRFQGPSFVELTKEIICLGIIDKN